MTQPIAANTTHTNPSNLSHYPALDGLRAIAFVMVLLTHYCHLPWGFAGVNLFFVLSGFLITGILVDTRDRPDRVRRFYLRRSLRIFPLYYGVILGVLLLYPLLHWRLSWPWLAWPMYLGNLLRLWGKGARDPAVRSVAMAWLHSRNHPTITLAFGHFWSLCTEEQFYLLWPWIVFRVRSRFRLMSVCAAAILLCPVLRSVVQNHTPDWMTSVEFTWVTGVPFQLDALLLGGLLSLLWRGEYRESLQKAASVCLGVLMCFLVVFVLRTLAIYPLGSVCKLYRYPDWMMSWDLSLLNLFGAALLICALKPGSITYRSLNLSWLRYLGRISYGAYVFHDIPHMIYLERVERLRFRLHLGAWFTEPATLALACVGTLVLATLSYYCFEVPFLNLKERWTASRPYGSGLTVQGELVRNAQNTTV